jgi:sugar phosphate isomerase/epimerase
METGISTLVDLDVPIAELARMVAAAGFTHISLSHDIKHARYHLPEGREDLRRLLDETGLKLNYIHPPLECYHDLTSPEPQVRRATIEMMKLALDAVAALGGCCITVHVANESSIPDEQFPQRIRSGLESLRELADYAGQCNAAVTVENLPGTLDIGRLSLEVIRATADQPEIKVCLDSCHATMHNSQAIELVRELAPRVLTTHMSDTMGDEDSHLVPGEGNVDYPAITRELGRAGFTGVVDLECSLWMLRRRHDRGASHADDPVPCSTEHYLERSQAAAAWLGELIERSRADAGC